MNCLSTALPAAALLALGLAAACDGGGGAASASGEDAWTRTASGLEYQVVKQGTGNVHPELYDQVKVRYTIELENGRTLLNTKGRPETRQVGVWMKAFTEGVQLMVVGDRYRFRVPAALARDPNDAIIRGIPDGRDVVFEMLLVDLLEVPQFRKPDPEVAKPHPKAPDVLYEIVEEGAGEPPGPEDIVVLHVTSWNEGGMQLETTLYEDTPLKGKMRDLPVAFLKAVPRLMKPGAKARFGVPFKYTYAKQPRLRPANLPRGARSYWFVHLVKVLRPLPVPEFVTPDATKVQETASGLKYEIIEPGQGERQPLNDAVLCHYAGWTEDGKLFDSSYERGEPATLVFSKVIPGMSEAMRMIMKPGGKYRLVIPPDLAYGAEGSPPKIKPDATLLFYVDMQAFAMSPEMQKNIAGLQSGQGAEPANPAQAPPGLTQDGIPVRMAPLPVPEFRKPRPRLMKKTQSGLRYWITDPGSGAPPERGQLLRMHMTTWLRNGKLIGSSYQTGGPVSVPMNNMLGAVQEGVRMLRPGGKAWLLLTPDLAFGETGNPKTNIPPNAHVLYLVEYIGIDDGTPYDPLAEAAKAKAGKQRKRQGKRGAKGK